MSGWGGMAKLTKFVTNRSLELYLSLSLSNSWWSWWYLRIESEDDAADEMMIGATGWLVLGANLWIFAIRCTTRELKQQCGSDPTGLLMDCPIGSGLLEGSTRRFTAGAFRCTNGPAEKTQLPPADKICKISFWSEAVAQRSAEPGMQREALSLRGDLDKGREMTERSTQPYDVKRKDWNFDIQSYWISKNHMSW
jgi:hypothetical protein